MGTHMSGRITSYIKNQYTERYTELEKFLKKIGDKYPQVAEKIDGYKEIVSAMKEANGVLGKIETMKNAEVVDYKQYMYYLSEKMANVTKVMNKYNVTEQLMNLLGENKDKEIHYPYPDKRLEEDFQRRYGKDIAVNFKDPNAVFERLCIHMRDVSQSIDDFQRDLKEDIREANENIKTEYERWKANVNRYKDPDDINMDPDLIENGLSIAKSMAYTMKENHNIDLDNMNQYKEALEDEERFIQQAKSFAKSDENGTIPYTKFLRREVKIKEHVYYTNKQYEAKQEALKAEKINEANEKKVDELKAEELKADEPQISEEQQYKIIAKSLKDAKTVVNSKQYNDLCKIFEVLADPKQSAALSEEKKKALLATAGKTVNEYITHKAKDGVKPNVFKKLAAVEATSKFLEKKYAQYKDQTIRLGESGVISIKDIDFSLDGRKKLLNEGQLEVFDGFMKEKDRSVNMTCENIIKNVENKNVKNIMSLSNKCMDKIIAEAFAKKVGAVYELQKIRMQFVNKEFVEKELANKAPQAEAAKDGVMRI